MKPGTLFTVLISALALCVGCGGSQKPAKHAHDSDHEDESSETSSSEDVEPLEGGGPREDKNELSGPRQEKEIDSSNPKNNPDPEFKEGGSVDEAINAVPQGLPRENIDPEALNQPLLDTSLYAECKLSPANHFEIKFAVWDGRIVGMDIKSKPKNPKLEDCVRNATSKAKWREKSKSLNISTVMF